MEQETFFSLVTNLAHWELELFIMFIFDVVIGLLIWPRLRSWGKHHRSDDSKIEILEKKVQRLEDIIYNQGDKL